MKRPSSGLDIGLKVLAGLVAVYLAGGIMLSHMDDIAWSRLVTIISNPGGEFLSTIYRPFFRFLNFIFR